MSTATANRPRTADLRELFDWKNEAEICVFLDEHAYLRPFLPHAATLIRQVFGRTTRLTLAVESYRDVAPAERALWIYAKYSGEVDETLNRLRRVDEFWVREFEPAIRNMLNFDTRS